MDRMIERETTACWPLLRARSLLLRDAVNLAFRDNQFRNDRLIRRANSTEAAITESVYTK